MLYIYIYIGLSCILHLSALFSASFSNLKHRNNLTAKSSIWKPLWGLGQALQPVASIAKLNKIVLVGTWSHADNGFGPTATWTQHLNRLSQRIQQQVTPKSFLLNFGMFNKKRINITMTLSPMEVSVLDCHGGTPSSHPVVSRPWVSKQPFCDLGIPHSKKPT